MSLQGSTPAGQGSVDLASSNQGTGGGPVGTSFAVVGKFSAVSGSDTNPSTIYMDDGGQAGGASFYRYPTSARTFARLRLSAPLGTTATPPTATLYRNGVATAMTCTLGANEPAGTTVLDAAHPIAFAAGDTFDVVLTQPINAEGPSYFTATLEAEVSGGSGGGGEVESVTAQTANAVNNTDPKNPIIQNASATNAGTMSAAHFALMPEDVRDTLVATGSILRIAGLAPTDGDYEGYFYLPINAVTTGLVKLQINDSDADLYAGWVDEIGASTLAGGRSAGSWELCPDTQASNLRIVGWLKLRSNGTDLFVAGTLDLLYAEGPACRRTVLCTTAAKTISSLRIIAANANAFQAGAYFQLRKLKRQYP